MNEAVYEEEILTEAETEFPQKEREKRGSRISRQASAQKRKEKVVKAIGGTRNVFFSTRKGRVMLNGHNKGVRFVKKQASKKARRNSGEISGKGNAYRKVYDADWLLW